MVMFFQMLGGALAPSVGQKLFTDGLLQNLSKMQGIDSAVVVVAGANGFRAIFPPELMNAVVDALILLCGLCSGWHLPLQRLRG